MSVAGDTSTTQGDISGKLRRSGPSPYLQPLLNSRQRWVYGAGIVLWVLAQVYFWEWWLRPEHVVNVFLFTYMSVAFAWLSSHCRPGLWSIDKRLSSHRYACELRCHPGRPKNCRSSCSQPDRDASFHRRFHDRSARIRTRTRRWQQRLYRL